MLQHFRLIPFLAGIAIGYYLLAYYHTPSRVIQAYPDPATLEQQIYRNPTAAGAGSGTGGCYRYVAEEVDCDKNEHRLRV